MVTLAELSQNSGEGWIGQKQHEDICPRGLETAGIQGGRISKIHVAIKLSNISIPKGFKEYIGHPCHPLSFLLHNTGGEGKWFHIRH